MGQKSLLVTEAEAARLLQVSPRFLQLRRYRGGGPEFVRVGARAIRYRVEDLQAWAAERLCGGPAGSRSDQSDAASDCAPQS